MSEIVFPSSILNPVIEDIEKYLKDPNYNIDKQRLFKIHTTLNERNVKINLLKKFKFNEKLQELFLEDDDREILGHIARTTKSQTILEKLSRVTKISYSKLNGLQYELNRLYWDIFWNPVCTEEIQKSMITENTIIFVRDLILDPRTSTSILEYIANNYTNMICCLNIPKHSNSNLSILEKLSKSKRWATRKAVFYSSICSSEIKESLKDDPEIFI
jgi:hypothetical protein